MDDILKNLTLQFSKSELNHLIGCAERVLGAGHWGSSDIIIPEEQNLLAMLKKSKGVVKLSPFYLKMLVDWIGTATNEGAALLPEDQSIIEKCRSAFEEYHEAVERDYRLRQGNIRSLKESFAVMGIKAAIKDKEINEKGSKGKTDASLNDNTSYRREDYEREVFGGNYEAVNSKAQPPAGSVKKSLAKALDAGKQQSFFSHKERESKGIDMPGGSQPESDTSETENSKPLSRFKRIKDYFAKAFDAGVDRSFSASKGSCHKERDAMKDHVEKAEKLQTYLKKKGKKL